MGYSMKNRDGSAGLLDDYLRHLEQISEQRLSAQEEIDLAKSVAAGDQNARNKLIEANAKLVIHIASQYTGRGLSLEDLVGEGNLGLIRATQEFEPSFGTRFSTYAVWWIKQAIRAALTNTGSTIRLPSHMVALLQKWSKAQRQLERQLNREAAFNEIADYLHLNATHREHVRKAIQSRYLASESSITDHDGVPWSADRVMDQRDNAEQSLEHDEERLMLLRRLTRLDDRERAVITLRYGLHQESSLTWAEISQRLGVTREWARKIELRALEKMRPDGPDMSSVKRTTGKNRTRRDQAETIIPGPPGGAIRNANANPKVPKPASGSISLPTFSPLLIS